MTCTLHVAWDDRLTSYDFGPGHPLAPVRVELTMALALAMGVLDADGVRLAVPEPATQEQLELVHDPGYIEAVRRAEADPLFGLGTPDDPVFPGMHEASALVAGATLAAAAAMWSGQAAHGANVAGGLHHAMRRAASGFCVYNDPAIAIRWLLEQGAQRIAYVDIDVHHGDGVQAAFYNDPRVLTISLHEHPMTLFPGTGLPGDTGGPQADGMAVNVALPAGTGDADWLRAFDAIVPPLLRAFRPEILVSQHGCDTHRLDPLAHLELTIDGQRAAHQKLHELAHEVAGGRWLLTGGGGYELVQVVPRTWTHLLAVAAGRPLDPGLATPASWQEYTLDPDRGARTRADDRRRHGGFHPVRVRLQPGSCHRPVHHVHPQRRLSRSRAFPGSVTQSASRAGVALFRTRLTLGTEVTDALNPARRTRLRAEEGKADGCRRNSAQRRQVPDRGRSGLDHARIENDRLPAGALGGAGGDPGRPVVPGSRAGGEPVPEGVLRRGQLMPIPRGGITRAGAGQVPWGVGVGPAGWHRANTSQACLPESRVRVVSWARSSRSAVSEWRRRSTASCCGRPACSGATRSNAAPAPRGYRWSGPGRCGRARR